MADSTVRFAQFNASLNRNASGELLRDLSAPNNAQAKATAEIIQRVNADVILINEFDYDASNPIAIVDLLRKNYLEVSQNGAAAVKYPYVYIAPSNTGIASGFDLNNNGQTVTTPGAAGYGDDAFGFGNFPGQFGMVLLSKYPIDTANIRTFQNFLWKDMPGNLLTNDPTIDNPATPVNENLKGFYSAEEQAKLRLSSKSHWDVPILVNGEIVHALVSHPTPPVFDGTEDRNGKRNYDEIRFWSDYVTPGQTSSYIYDDRGLKGGIAPGTQFVIMGDQNADPNDGDSYNAAVRQLLQNPNINTNFIPTSLGGPQQSTLQRGANATQKSNPAFDTADFADTTPGNLRADYLLPSNNLQITNAGVFWPLNTDPTFAPVGVFTPTLPGGYPSSDHRAIFADINLEPSSAKNVNNAKSLGQAVFPTATTQTLNGISTQIGGLSGITYDAANNRYYIISDDRGDRTPTSSPASPPPSANIPPRFYTAQIDPTKIASGGVTFTGVTLLKDSTGKTFEPFQLDPEGIALTNKGTVFVSSEGEVNITAGRVTNPFVNEFNLATGQQVRALAVPTKFLPVVEDTNNNGKIDTGDTQKSGIRNNLAFESLTISPNQQFLYTANEGALLQDGNIASLTDGSRVRIVQYNLVTGQAEKEYLYVTDKIAQAANPSTGFQDNGLVDLLAIDDRGTFLALERSFAQGVGNTIKIYEVNLQGATDISFYDSLTALSAPELAAIRPTQKRLILNLDDLKLTTGLDNVEGIGFGPKLANGNQSLILTSDNNFSATQFTQIIALETSVSDRPTLTTYDWNNRPVIGQAGGQDILLGGFSGLFYQGLSNTNGNLKFVTLTDRGPNGTDQAGKRPFALPAFQPEIVNFELNQQTGAINITQRLKLTDSSGKAITGLPNLQAGATGLAYTDEIPIDLAGKTLSNDALGADVEGIVVAPNGDYWLVDEYRPAIYQFNNQGQLLNRFVPAGTAAAGGKPAGTFGTEALPAVYAQRRANRGFEAIALEGNKLYAFIQSAIDNPDNTGDTTSRGSRNLRILEFDVTTSKTTGEYLYLLDDITGAGNARTDKLGDAVSLGNGKFAVVERDDLAGVNSNKLIYQIDLKGATNIANTASLRLPTGKTIEQLTPAELVTAGITPVSKSLIANAAQAGYTGVEKLEGLALIDANTLALINDNDFGITETVYNADGSVKVTIGNTPVKVGLLDLSKDLPVAKPAFPNGVASGDTTQNSTVLWTRANVLGNVTFEYSTSANFSNIIGKKTANVTDVLQPVKVEITGLNPGTTYYYRAIDATGNRLNGQLKTANAPGQTKGLTFGVSGDWRGELAPYPAISNAASKQLDFFVLHGDTIYADDASPALRDIIGIPKPQAETINDYRLKHDEVYGVRFGQNTWADLRASTSVYATIDDHEVINDFAGGALASSDPRFKDTTPGRLINDTALFDNGLQVFQEYNPLRDEFYGNTGDPRTAGERKLYRSNTFGSDAATFILDTRSFRDTGIPGPTDFTNPQQVGAVLSQTFAPNRTLLGKAQLDDLKRDLLAAQANGVTWKFVMVPEPIQNIFPGINTDAFEGYNAERTELLKFINDNALDNVVFISADVHTTFVNNVTYQERAFGPQIATGVWEITTGAVAYERPTGEFLANLFIGQNQQLRTLYNSLPIAPDTDNIANDKDDFVKQLVNSQLLAPLGYDPLGLDNNLAQANGLIDAKLLQGDYFVGHAYSWSEFDINPTTQKLTVTTWGINSYTEAELLANPKAILERQPRILSQFEVDPKQLQKQGTAGDDTLFGGNGADNINALGGNNTVYAGEGNNFIRSGSGNDRIYTGSGDDTIQAGAGNNLIYAGEGRNSIFTEIGDDTIYAGSGNDTISAGLGNNLIYAGEGSNTIISSGIDTIYTGSGSDRFVLDRGTGEATIIGFNASNDRITLGGTLKFGVCQGFCVRAEIK